MSSQITDNSAPIAAMEEAKLRALRMASGFLLAAPAAYLLLLFAVFPEHARRGIGPAMILLLSVASRLLLHAGRTRAAARLLIYGGWAGLTVSIGLGGGIYAPQVVALPLIVILAGWLLGLRHAAAVTFLSVLLALAATLLHGLLPETAPAPPLLAWLTIALITSLVCALIWYIVSSYEGRLEEVHRLGAELSRQVEVAAAERNQLHLLAENVPAMILHGDRALRCRYANLQFADFFHGGGVPIEGMHLREILGEELFEAVQPRLQRVLAGERMQFEGRRISRSGEERLLDISLVPETDATGAVVGFYAMKRDVTDKRLSEQSLAQSEAQLRLVTENVPAMIAYNDTDLTIRYANRQYLEFFGVDAASAFGHPIRDIIGAEAFEKAHPFLERTILGEKVHYRGTRGNSAGETRILEIDTVPDRDQDGKVRGAYALMRDVTEQARAEEKFAKIFSATPLPATISRVDTNRFIDINEAAVQFGGWRREEMIGRTSLELNLWPDPQERQMALDVLRQTGRLRDIEVTYRTRSGDLRSTLVSAEILELEGAPCILTVIHDVTKRKQAEEAVRRLKDELEDRVRHRTADLTAANRELESFAYSISHDLRAPLRGIDGFSHLLAEEYAERLDETGRGYLDRVRRAAQRMGHLIDDILELSRVTRQEMRRVPVDLSQIAAELAEERSRSEPERHIETLIAPGCRAFGDPQLMRVLMQNLLENAWKYSGKADAPKVEFGCETSGGQTVFYVRDNGVGFDMQYANRLFTPFQRLHKPEEFEGTGIGLATVARVVHRHGGHVSAESAPGQGATFRFSLPS